MVIKLPLANLITSHGDTKCIGDVGAESILALLRGGKVRFVIADVGHDLQWLAETDCLDVWKREVQLHLAEPDQRVYLGEFPNEYAYFASQWDDGATPIVLLSKAH